MSLPQFLESSSGHAGRIPHYRYYQQVEGLSIGSGPMESWVKQIDARQQVTGAQWQGETLPQMLQLRAAYLNHQWMMCSL